MKIQCAHFPYHVSAVIQLIKEHNIYTEFLRVDGGAVGGGGGSY